jgi:hypothetical protein
VEEAEPLNGLNIVTSQDFIKFWGKFFVLVLFEISQGFKTFEFIKKLY